MKNPLLHFPLFDGQALLRVVFLGGILLGTIIFVPWRGGGFALPKLLLFSLAAAIGILMTRGEIPALLQHLFHTTVGRLFVFFWVVVLLSPLWSVAPMVSIVGSPPRFEGVIAYVVFLGLALVAGSMVRSGREQDLLHVVFWSNAGVVLYGLLQVVGMDPFEELWDADPFLWRVFSTVGQPNMLGQFLILTAPFAVLTAWRWRGSPLGMGVLVANILVLLATGSRAGVLGALVVMVIILWLLRTRERNPWGGIPSLKEGMKSVPPSPFTKGEGQGERVSRASFPCRYVALSPVPSPTAVGEGGPCCERGCRLLLCTSLVLAVMVSGFLIGARRFTLPGEWDRSLHGRLVIWRDAVTMIRARPIGWGLETTGLVFPRFQRAPLGVYESLTTSIDRAHSKPLDLLLTVGPLGLFSYYTFLALLFSHCLRAWRRRGDALALAGMASLMGVSVSLLFGFEGIVVHAFFWLIYGMLTTLTLPSPFEGRGCCSEKPITKFPPPFKGEGIVPTLSVILLVVVVIAGFWLSARFTVEHGEQLFREGRLAEALPVYAQAIRRAPWDRDILVQGIETALRGIEVASDEETRDRLHAFVTRKITHLDRLTSGEDGYVPLLTAWHAALRGEKKDALAFLNEAKKRAPFSVHRLRIAALVAYLLKDQAMEKAIHAELRSMLPPWWNDPQHPRHRILQKEHPWLVELFVPPSPTAVGEGMGEGDKQQ